MESQNTVDKVVSIQHLQFNVEIYMNDENITPSAKKDRFQIVTKDELTFLDMKITWYPEGGLQFGLFR